MSVANILSMAGGLGLFLFGIRTMGDGLENAYVSQYLSRTVHKHRSDHDEQEHGKHQQHLGSGTSEILAYKRR